MATRRTLWGLVLAPLFAAGGCASDRFHVFGQPEPPPPPAEGFVLRGDGLVPDKPPAAEAPAHAQLAHARELFRREDYGRADDAFYTLADNKKNPVHVIQEALYYRAECHRLQGSYPKAADLYVALLNDFPQNPYREQAVQHMFDIANYWLNDTRAEMREDLERREGKRWFVWPRFVSFDKSKPLLDREGRAVEKLEQVRLHDINGPLADHALFLCGTVKLYNENFREADQYFSQIPARHPESKLAPKAIELAIYCKHMSTGGADYDGRKAAEARELVQTALGKYPELAHQKRDFLMGQLKSINLQQAEKDYKQAEFYRRTGHPGPAYWYYDLVRRRYPGTKYAELAGTRMNELRHKLEQEQGPLATPAKAVVEGGSPAPAQPGPPSN